MLRIPLITLRSLAKNKLFIIIMYLEWALPLLLHVLCELGICCHWDSKHVNADQIIVYNLCGIFRVVQNAWNGTYASRKSY